MTSLKLTYFNDGKGRNELSRLILAVGEIPYEDELIDHMTFKRLRDEDDALPYGQIPTLTVNGEVFGQSCSIARYVAKKAGLYPDNDLEELKTDGVVDSWRDCLDLFYECVFGRVVVDGKLSMKAHPPPSRYPKLMAFVNSELSEVFRRYEHLLKPNGGQLCEELFPSWADLAIYDIVKTMECALEKETYKGLIDSKPALEALVFRLDSNPQIQSHLEKHPYKSMSFFFPQGSIVEGKSVMKHVTPDKKTENSSSA